MHSKEYDVIWTFKMAAANSKMADIKYKCCRFCHRTMHFLNRETICILKADIMKTRGHDFSKWRRQFQDGRQDMRKLLSFFF